MRTKGKRPLEMQGRSSFLSLGFWGFDFPNSVFAILFFGFILNAHQRRRQDAEKSRNRYIQRSRVKYLPHNACVTCEARPAKQVGAILAGLSGIFSFFFELSYVPMDLCIVHTE